MSTNGNGFFDKYLSFVSDGTESPISYHRWSAITAIGALLEKNFYLQHGHSQINPNLYVMLIGNPGTRKSSAIKLATGLVKDSGYKNIAADKTTKEKFLEDLASISKQDMGLDSFLDAELGYTGDPASMLISADEFNEFAGAGNLEFYALLGSLWDKKGNYYYKTKQGETVIPDPVVSMLGGNTPTGFATAFPSEIIGQGFFSRMLLIYGEPTGVKIAFPKPPDPKLQAYLISFMQAIRSNVRGEAQLTTEAKSALEEIYIKYTGFIDPRFESYTNRRFNQLIKLCLIHSAARLSTEVTLDDVILSNTVLTYAEQYMPKALGEFGNGKHSSVTHKVMIALEATHEPLTVQDIWALVANDLDSIAQLAEIIRNLAEAKKIQKVSDSATGTVLGFLPERKKVSMDNDKYIDYTLLTETEQNASY